MKRYLQFFLIMALVSLLANTGCGQTDTAQADREAKIVEALKLCGKISAISVGDLSASGVQDENLDSSFRNDLVKILLAKSDSVFTLPVAAKMAAAKYQYKGTIDLLTNQSTDKAEIAQIQDILGKEDAEESSILGVGGQYSSLVTWHKYDWCSFGVKDGKVQAVRADCRAVKP